MRPSAHVSCDVRADVLTRTLSQVNVKGFDSTIGFTQWANKPAEQDAPVRASLPPVFVFLF